MKFWISIVAASCAPAVVAAACVGAGEPIFQCDFHNGAKTVDVCLQDEVAIYRYGPKDGAAEMILARHLDDLDYHPSSYASQTIINQVIFYNDNEANYLIEHTWDRRGEGDGGMLIVGSPDRELGRWECDPNSIEDENFLRLFEAARVGPYSGD